MSLPAILYTLSAVPLFASRPFTAAFLTAVVARWGVSWPWIGDNAIVVALHGAPEWFQSATSLSILGVLSLLEVLSAKSPEVREVLEQVDRALKTAIAVLVAFALVDNETAKTLDAIQKAGFGFDSAWALVVGGATWAAAGLRAKLVELVTDADDGDDVGLQSMLAWAENSAAFLGVLFLLIFPLAALALSALTTLGIWWVRRRAEAKEASSRVPCAKCATPILPHASACHHCGHELAEPRAVGVFGQPKAAPTPDRSQHGFELVSRKRCPTCATRLRQRAVQQACPTCGKQTFASEAEFERYLAVIAARLPRTLLISLGLGAIPLLGVIPGVLYYRLNLVSGLRGYIPPLRGCTTKWLVRLIHFGVIALQPIPLVGAVVLPFMCWSTYAIYRRSLTGRARDDLRVEPAAARG